MNGMLSDMKPEYPDADRPTVFDEGVAFQDMVAKIFEQELHIPIDYYETEWEQKNIGESRQGIEVKLDTRILDTKNVSIEVAEKSKGSNPTWIPSGILRKDNTWLYVQGNPSIILVFGKTILKRVYDKQYKDRVWTPKPTIKTFLMPLGRAEQISLKVFRF